ncbi:MAG: hypothetical protein ACFBWO_04940 [Paracoccaceae bacterium]
MSGRDRRGRAGARCARPAAYDWREHAARPGDLGACLGLAGLLGAIAAIGALG